MPKSWYQILGLCRDLDGHDETNEILPGVLYQAPLAPQLDSRVHGQNLNKTKPVGKYNI